jgi:hypothetical protein
LTNKIIHGIYLLIAGTFLVSCANPVTPSGGPKDTAPPEFVKSEPPMHCRNFHEEKIKITFNEFIQLKELNNQVIISPPMTIQPEFKLKGKSLLIEIKDQLKENTTYNIFFGSAIVDLTEGNPFENFQFIFSTGNVIDSLSIDGKVHNAFDLAPLKSVNIMLYTHSNDTIVFDSLPYFVKPFYMTKTDEAGNFSLKNLADQPYKIFALNDLNGNLIYDQPTESIGFIEDTIMATYIPPRINDTIENDSVNLEKIVPPRTPENRVKLAVFQEIDSIQKLLKVTVPKKNQILFIFKRPTHKLSVVPLNKDIHELWSIAEFNENRDSISYWVKDIGIDSLHLKISENDVILDTIKIALFRKSKGKKSESKDEKPEKLEIKNNLKSNLIDLNKPLTLTFGYPLQKVDTAGIKFYENDTIPLKVKYSFADSVNRKITFDYRWKKATSYSILIYDSALVDIHNHKNDSLLIKFTSKSPEDYGNLSINLEVPATGINHIIQLISGGAVVRETQIKETGRVSFTYLNPGKHTLKVIFDDNNNGTWDTGDYIYKVQPETVRFFTEEINVRANWDVEEDWKL